MYLKTNHRNDALANLQALREEREGRQQIIHEARGEPSPAPSALRGPLDLSQIAPTVHDDPMMVAAPPSKNGSGMPGRDPQTKFTMTKEEAWVAVTCNMTPAEYVKRREEMRAEIKSGYRQS